MTSFAITCPCGERFYVEGSHLGRVITCARCKRAFKPRSQAKAASDYVHVAQPARRAWRARVAEITKGIPRLLRQSWSFSDPRVARHPVIFYLAVCSWLTLAAVSGIAMSLPLLGDRSLAVTVILYAGRWIYLVPVGLFAALAAITRRALLVPLGLAALVVLGPIMGGQLGLLRLWPAPVGVPLRVVTLNTGARGHIGAEIVAFLDESRPDVALLQECSTSLQGLLRTLPRYHMHASSGLCMISRFPIDGVEVMNRDDLERVKGRDGDGAGGAGYVVRYQLDSPAGPLGVTNLHLETARKGLESLLDGDIDLVRLQDNMSLREVESQRARAFADRGVIPMIVAGDFNAPPQSRNFRDYWSDMTNAFSRVGTGFGTTRYNGWIRLRIDHLLHSTGVRAVRASVGRDVGSDHRPLVVDLIILPRVTDS